MRQRARGVPGARGVVAAVVLWVGHLGSERQARVVGLQPQRLGMERQHLHVLRVVQRQHAVVRRQAPGTWLPLQVDREGDLRQVVARFPALSRPGE